MTRCLHSIAYHIATGETPMFATIGLTSSLLALTLSAAKLAHGAAWQAVLTYIRNH